MNIILTWVDYKDFEINPNASKKNVNVVSEYRMNDMGLVEIYEDGDGCYLINDTFVPISGFGGAYDFKKFKKITTVKKYIEKYVSIWLNNKHQKIKL